MSANPLLQSCPAGSSPSSGAHSIRGTGEMAERTRVFDWSMTSIGPIAEWPDALLITVNTLLASRHPMFLWWGKDLIQFYNDGYRPSIGADKHPKALGQRGPECWPEIWPSIGPQIEAVMRDGEATWHEDQLLPIFRDGELEDVYWTYSYSPVREASGSICGTLVTCSESTGRVLAERRLKKLFEATTDAVLSIDRDWRITYMNDRAKRLVAPERDVVGSDLWESYPAALYEGSPFVEHYNRAMYQDAGSEFETFYGEPLNMWIHVVARPVETGIIVFFRDVTERKRAEAALIENEKLAAVGRLAASIAHEINNPLESVTNLIFLARGSKELAEAEAYLEAADRELRRAAAITIQTLRFHKQSTNPTEVHCEELIESVLRLYQGRIVNSHVRVQKQMGSCRPIRCFEGEIRQALSNFVGNAIDAMHPEGGRLLLRSREGWDWRTGREGSVITVADTGPGMSAQTARRAFEAFFTTKGIGGNGLGLWISKEIIARHHGAIAVKSGQRKGRSGTVLRLFLPFEAVVR